MKKWVAAALVGVVLVGCQGGNGGVSGGSGGSGGGSGGSGGGGGGGGVTAPVVALPDTKSHVSLTFLSGQGRRSTGSMYAEITGMTLTGNGTDVVPPNLAIDGGLPFIRTQLDGYTVNKASFTQDLAPFSSSTSAKTGEKVFQNLDVFLNKLYLENADGSLTALSTAPTLPTFDLLAKLFPGRYTNITTYINDAEFVVDPVTGAVTFDEPAWEVENFKGGLTMLRANLSDFVSFDISGLASADRPDMSAGGKADKFMVTGDQTGLGNGFGTDGSFDLVDEGFITPGVLTKPTVIGGVGGSDTANGTYNVTEPDPRVLPPDVALLSAVQGIWRPFDKLITNVTGTAMIVFPSSHDTADQVVAVKVDGTGKVTALWFGTVTFSGNSGTFTMYPVSAASTLDKTGVTTVTGTVRVTNSFTWTPLDKNGNPIKLLGNPITNKSPLGGTFAAAGAPAAWPFGASGSFLVFR